MASAFIPDFFGGGYHLFWGSICCSALLGVVCHGVGREGPRIIWSLRGARGRNCGRD